MMIFWDNNYQLSDNLKWKNVHIPIRELLLVTEGICEFYVN